jgi:MinD superfamily P-loop ATPase
MNIAIASGKGGTGKTLVATSLAISLHGANASAALVDCDVEAPNDHLFLQPTYSESRPVTIAVPSIDAERCTHCGECARVCNFHAIAVAPKTVLVFDELCHGCGACSLICPENAITETPHTVGVISRGEAHGMPFAAGELQIGEPLAVPIIHQLTANLPATDYVILDSPPGNACSLVATLKHADFALLVTEPTPFGLHDLRAAVSVARTLGVPAGLVINRAGNPYPALEGYCQEVSLPILMRIPFDRRIAEGYAAGQLLVETLPEYREQFIALAQRIAEEVAA